MSYDLTNPYEIPRYIKESKKSTPVKVYIDGNLVAGSLAKIIKHVDYNTKNKTKLMDDLRE